MRHPAYKDHLDNDDRKEISFGQNIDFDRTSAGR